MDDAEKWFKKGDPKVSDIINYSVLLAQTEKLYTDEQQGKFLTDLAEAIEARASPDKSDLSAEDTAQLGKVLTTMSEHLKKMPEVNYKLTWKALTAVNSVLQNGRHYDTQEKEIAIQAISEDTFNSLASSVDNLIDVNDEHGVEGEALVGH